MGCCVGENYGNWCNKEKTFKYKDDSYCLFHAPAECDEKRDVDKFNDRVYALIKDSKERGIRCILSGSVFPGGISFERYGTRDHLPPIHFDFVEFTGDVDFSGSTLSGNASFCGARFCQDVFFHSAAFDGETDFSTASFCGEADFRHTHFKNNADFRHAVFNCDALFSNSLFGNNALMSDIIFGGNTYFRRTTFKGFSLFEESRFLAICDFQNTIFTLRATFDKAFFKNLRFEYTHFEKPAYFLCSKFSAVSFATCLISEHLEFERSDLGRVSLARAPLESFRFIDCTWPERKSSHILKKLNQKESSGRKTIFDARHFLPIANLDEQDSRANKPSPSHLADMFRRLKKIAITEHDHALASDWHYNQKEMERIAAKEDGRGAMRWILELYKLFAGYGEALRNATFFLLALITLPIILDLCLSFFGIFLPGTYTSYLPVFRQPDFIGNRFWQIPMVVWKLLVTVQAGLFGLALRNKLRR